MLMRAFASDDAEFVFRVFSEARTHELRAAGLDDASLETLLRMQHRAQQASYRQAYPGAERVVLLSRDTPVGYALIDRAHDAFTLLDLALLEGHRGCGLGGSVLRALQREAAERRVLIRLHVRPENPARRLYQRLGFEVIARSELELTMEWRAVGRDAASRIERGG